VRVLRARLLQGGLILAVATALGACTSAQVQAFGDALGRLNSSGGGSVGMSDQPLLVFGGQNHKTFLGCFCSEYDADSLLNQYSSYGSEYSRTSIFNRYSEFGSPYSTYSACNEYASDPPVVVTKDGEFVGRLTTNRYAPGSLSDTRLGSWLAAVCRR
jgi:hypothetical protein